MNSKAAVHSSADGADSADGNPAAARPGCNNIDSRSSASSADRFLVPLLGRNLARFAGVVAIGLTGVSLAFPPAPHHLVHGLVRDEQGNPLDDPKAVVQLEVGGTIVSTATVSSVADVDGNYRLTIPLDSGVTAQRYKPTAQLPSVPFRMRVKIGNVNYVPIHMNGVSSLVTKAGGLSRVDLTLGEDLDGDGMPDAWERTLMAASGGTKTLADIRPGGDDDGDGMTNLAEYLAGTYAFDPEDGFTLSILGVEAGRSQLEFTAIRGRTYTIESSNDMKTWTPVNFQVGTGAEQGSYVAKDVRPVRVSVGAGTEASEAPRFFKVMVH